MVNYLSSLAEVVEDTNRHGNAADIKAKLDRYRRDKALKKAAEKRAHRQPFKVGVYKLDGKFPTPSANQKAVALGKTTSMLALASSTVARNTRGRQAKVASKVVAPELKTATLAQRKKNPPHEGNSTITSYVE